MSRFNRLNLLYLKVFVVLLATANIAHARRSDEPRTEIGLSYNIWNERITIGRAGISQAGYAGFGGFSANIESNWIRGRWQWGWQTGFGIGKASIGGIDNLLPEGRDRPWYLAYAKSFGHYRINPNFMMGLTGISRYRGVDWTTLDSGVVIDASSRLQLTGGISLRWTVDQWSFTQVFAPLNFAGDTLWEITLQYSPR